MPAWLATPLLCGETRIGPMAKANSLSFRRGGKRKGTQLLPRLFFGNCLEQESVSALQA